MDGVIGDVAAVFTRWRIWWLLGLQDISMRYRRSVLGPFWISLSMAAMVFGIGFLYSQIFNTEFKAYLAFLGAGFLVWGMISANMVEGCSTLIDAEAHLRSVRLPASVLSARLVWRNFVIFLHNFVVIALVLLYAGIEPTPALALAPFGLAVIALFGFFASLALGPLTLRFRDISQIVANFMQIMFFVTPVIWMPSQGRIDSIWVESNPLFHLIELVRAPLLGAYPTANDWVWSLATLGAVGLAALAVDAATRRKVFLWL